MAEWFRLKKDGKTYKTQSEFLRTICVQFKGYSSEGNYFGRYGILLPFKLTKEERDKYKVILRLMK